VNANLPKVSELLEGMGPGFSEYLARLHAARFDNPSVPEPRLPEVEPVVDFDGLITSDYLADAIRPWIELLRSELFGSAAVPFANTAQSEDWLISAASNEPDLRDVVDGSAYSQAFDHLRKALPDRAFSIGPSLGRSLRYIGREGKPGSVWIVGVPSQDWRVPQERQERESFTALSWLEGETRVMARATGFAQVSLVQYVLLGTKPLLPRARAAAHADVQALPSGETLHPVRVSIDVWARSLTFNELRDLYRQHRKYMTMNRRQTLDKYDWELYHMANSLGGSLSGKGCKATWEEIRRRWNEAHPERPYNGDWNGPKRAYRRMVEALAERVGRVGVTNEG